MAKTTKKDFELFKSECQKWIDIFGLKDWEVRFEHGYISDTHFAQGEYDVVERWLTLKLDTEWPDDVKITPHEIKKSAFHETTETGLLGKIRCIATNRTFDQDELDEEIHRIIMILQSVFVD